MPNYDEPRPRAQEYTPLTESPNPWLGRQAAEGYQNMLPTVAAGPGSAFSPEQLSGMHGQAMNQLQANTQQAMAGGQMAQTARGAAGPDLATLLGGQTDAANRGALAQGDLQAQMQGLELGNQQYQAATQAMGQMGGLAQGYAQLGAEERQFDAELNEAMRQFNSAQSDAERQGMLSHIQGAAETSQAQYNELLNKYADSAYRGDEEDIIRYGQMLKVAELRMNMAQNALFAVMDPSLRDPALGAIGGTIEDAISQNPWMIPGVRPPGWGSDYYIPGTHDPSFPGGFNAGGEGLQFHRMGHSLGDRDAYSQRVYNDAGEWLPAWHLWNRGGMMDNPESWQNWTGWENPYELPPFFGNNQNAT